MCVMCAFGRFFFIHMHTCERQHFTWVCIKYEEFIVFHTRCRYSFSPPLHILSIYSSLSLRSKAAVLVVVGTRLFVRVFKYSLFCFSISASIDSSDSVWFIFFYFIIIFLSHRQCVSSWTTGTIYIANILYYFGHALENRGQIR